MALLFTYGTLKKGFINAPLLSASRYIEIARTQNSLYRMVAVQDANYDFPGVIDGDSFIEGELYEVSDALLQQLDIFEGVGLDYKRTAIVLSNGQVAQWYVLTPHDGLDITREHCQITHDQTTNSYQWEAG